MGENLNYFFYRFNPYPVKLIYLNFPPLLLALSESFEYLCYGSPTIIIIFTLTGIDVSRQNLMSIDVIF